MKAKIGHSDLDAIESPEISATSGRYSIIYADPPWSFNVWSKETGHKRSAESHYHTLSWQELGNLNISILAKPDCALFCWVVPPSLPEAICCIQECWGFRYRTIAFTWVKTNRIAETPFWGMGYWSRANVELCLLATRGDPRRISKGVHQIIEASETASETLGHPVLFHSAKPQITRNRIVELMGDLPRIELFARRDSFTEYTGGWEATGLEYGGVDIRDYLSILELKEALDNGVE